MAFEILHDDHDRELAWLAFGYASGDLDAETALAFEQRLDNDQVAREALAEAVLLAGATALAARAERRGRGRRRLRRAACLALAASLAVVAVPWFLTTPARLDRPEPTTPDAVALAWSGLRHENETVNTTPDASAAGADALIDALAEPAAEPPAWLVEAAALTPSSDQGQNGQGS